MALAASAWVTTEHELKLPVLAAVVDVDATDEVGVVDEVGVADAVVVDAVVGGAVVVDSAVDDLDDEPHAANRMARETATTVPRALRGSLINPPPRP
jgi:hypothetical protein